MASNRFKGKVLFLIAVVAAVLTLVVGFTTSFVLHNKKYASTTATLHNATKWMRQTCDGKEYGCNVDIRAPSWMEDCSSFKDIDTGKTLSGSIPCNGGYVSLHRCRQNRRCSNTRTQCFTLCGDKWFYWYQYALNVGEKHPLETDSNFSCSIGDFASVEENSDHVAAIAANSTSTPYVVNAWYEQDDPGQSGIGPKPKYVFPEAIIYVLIVLGVVALVGFFAGWG